MAKNNAGTCVSLLTDDITYDGWQFTLGDKKAFYIRGATWFKTNVLREVTKLGKFIDELPDFEAQIRKDYPDWMIPGFDWDKNYSSRQAIDGLSLTKRKPLKFDKAVKTIHFCQIAAKKLKAKGKTDIDPSDVYKRMRIEPAVFYLSDLDSKTLEALIKEDEKILDDLRDACAQTHKLVFDDMAKGHTVTKKLAEGVEKLISGHKTSLSVGKIGFKHHDGLRKASDRETLSDDNVAPPPQDSEAANPEQKS
ncbi:MAG: hypothetical protein AAF636_19875 [Pseudomonadota bacterium]